MLEVVVETPDTSSGHRFFVPENSTMSVARAAELCQRVENEGEFIGHDWLGVGKKVKQSKFASRREGICRAVIVAGNRQAFSDETTKRNYIAVLASIITNLPSLVDNVSEECIRENLVVECEDLGKLLPMEWGIVRDSNAEQATKRKTNSWFSWPLTLIVLSLILALLWIGLSHLVGDSGNLRDATRELPTGKGVSVRDPGMGDGISKKEDDDRIGQQEASELVAMLRLPEDSNVLPVSSLVLKFKNGERITLYPSVVNAKSFSHKGNGRVDLSQVVQLWFVDEQPSESKMYQMNISNGNLIHGVVNGAAITVEFISR